MDDRAVQDGPNVYRFGVRDVTEWTRVRTTRSVPNDEGTAMVAREEWWDIPTFVVAALAASATDEAEGTLRAARTARLGICPVCQNLFRSDGHAYDCPLAASATDEAPSHLAERFDHDGTFRHHHDSITRDPIWWGNAEQFGGEKRDHRHAASATDEGRCLHCHESASGVCTLHNGSAALAPATEERLTKGTKHHER